MYVSLHVIVLVHLSLVVIDRCRMPKDSEYKYMGGPRLVWKTMGDREIDREEE